MATHWTEKRAGVAALGHALRDRGWTLYGWTEDQSDSMTDYYAPEHWDGIATKTTAAGELVAVVDRCENRDSGGRLRHRSMPGESCPRCKGAQADPDGITYQQAKADPAAYNAAAAGPGARALFPGVVSPLPFFGCGPMDPGDFPAELYGRERCRRCSGHGQLLKTEEYVEPWPTFQANPRGCTWHVERAGRTIARGTGVFACGSGGSRGQEKAAILAERIDALAQPHESGVQTPQEPTRGTMGEPWTIGAGTRPGYAEVRFPEKPPDDIREELKRAGFRWSRFSTCWYGPWASLPDRYRKSAEATAAEEARADLELPVLQLDHAGRWVTQ